VSPGDEEGERGRKRGKKRFSPSFPSLRISRAEEERRGKGPLWKNSLLSHPWGAANCRHLLGEDREKSILILSLLTWG